MQFINEEIAGDLRALGNQLDTPIPIRCLFDKRRPNSVQQKQLLEEVAQHMSKKLDVTFLDIGERPDSAPIPSDMAPVTIIDGKAGGRIRFFGVTAGQEFSTLIEAIVMASTGHTSVNQSQQRLVEAIRAPIHLEVIVTLTCPYCPRAVRVANQLAILNPNIRSDMIEASEFLDIVEDYQVRGVPKTMINRKGSFEGALSLEEVIKKITNEVTTKNQPNPEANKEYDTLIIGAGPAAMSAAIYAARKGLKVALIGEKIGGQVAETAFIENWLGSPRISGEELVQQFQRHFETYPLAELLRTTVTEVKKNNHGFIIRTSNEREFSGKSVVYCAGKKFRTIGAPGEDKYIGRGIAFCATCDAPLFSGKNVAVIGGGNSAFTAVKDLAPYAKSILVIHILKVFQADKVLREEVEKFASVKFLYPAQVLSFEGDVALKRIHVRLLEENKDLTLDVAGVFEEIGLTPNSSPVQNLISLNRNSEIPVKKDQSTEMPGFFAAGDVTDFPSKQIITAAGQGAQAAISAYNYLEKNGFLQDRILKKAA